MEINDTSDDVIRDLRDKIQDSIKKSSSLDIAAQRSVEAIYAEYKESLVLARLYATLPFESLPLENQNFVHKLTAPKNAGHLINAQTPVLSLMGTCGEEAFWNNRRNSQGHAGIPLISENFIEEIPMVARMLKELGMPLDWFAAPKDSIATQSFTKIVGQFYVADAQTVLDQKGRHIISAKDFVVKYNIKTVFGLGSVNILSRTFLILILFTRRAVVRSKVGQFMPLISGINTAASNLILQNKLFTQLTDSVLPNVG